jgi:AcrR family transcriptional regulator
MTATSRREYTRVRRAEARERIIAAAERLLTDRPYRDLTVDDVMAEAGLSRTVFYRHFEALPQVVLALLATIERDLEEQIPPGPADEQWLRTRLAVGVDVFADHARFLRALHDAASHDAELEAAYRAFMGRWIDETACLLPPGAESYEVARALNLMNSQYLMDTLGRDPGFDRELAQQTLLAIWSATAQYWRRAHT